MTPNAGSSRDGAVAFRDGIIVEVGKSAEIVPRVRAREVIDGRRFLVAPGLVNGHVHVTGEPLTRGFVPDDSGWYSNVFEWLVPLYEAQTEEDERLAAQLAAAELLRNRRDQLPGGRAPSATWMRSVDGLREIGVRGRVAQWAQDAAFAPDDDQGRPDRQGGQADAGGDGALSRRTGHADLGLAEPGRPHDGHRRSVARGLQLGAGLRRRDHRPHEPGGRQTRTGIWPTPAAVPSRTLADLGVLGPEVSLTHAVHLDDAEVALLAQTGTNVTHCPMSALKGGYGASVSGKFPEMAAQGVNLMLGTDGNNNGNIGDLMRAMFVCAGLFKDARRDTKLFPAHQVLTMTTLNGARGMGLSAQIGSLEVGKRADIVLHDLDRPEWRPLTDVVSQMVWSADGRGVHTVFVDGGEGGGRLPLHQGGRTGALCEGRGRRSGGGGPGGAEQSGAVADGLRLRLRRRPARPTLHSASS